MQHRAARAVALLAGIVVTAATAAGAGGVPTESARLGESRVTLHVHPFLSGQELTALRLVMSNEDALAVFVPAKGGYAAMAVSPDDGFIRDGVPVASAVALAGLPDADTATAQALAGCDSAKAGAAPCVVVLEVAPAKD